MQLTRSLRSQLTQCITIFNVGKCPKDKIRAHIYSPSSFDRPYAHFQGLALRSVDRFSISYVLDATALLREQFFRLGSCRPTGTGMIPCAQKWTLPAEFPSRGTSCRAALRLGLCLRLRMPLKLPACRAGGQRVRHLGRSITSSEAEKPQKDARPATCLASPNPVFHLAGKRESN